MTMSTSLKLGTVDEGAVPADRAAFLEPYHEGMSEPLKKKLMFRDEANGVWRSFQPVPGTMVHALQQFLKDSGFMPKANVDGIFGYATQAAVRLFQEYIRSVENDPSIGVPDGVAGPNTLNHVEKWRKDRSGKRHFVCAWGQTGAKRRSPEFQLWMALLKKANLYYAKHPDPILKQTESYPLPTDTQKMREWDLSPDTVHLIGIRRAQDVGAPKRANDDLFVLLIRGMVFKFWGSTDPNPGLADRADIPFLVEGQHHYKFGWHKISDNNTIYRALRPAGPGVLVFRDRNRDMALQDADIEQGLDKAPNTTINIHWSGIGTTNFSAGCQVLAGKSYLNHQRDLIDCAPFAAVSYPDLALGKTRGAYNVFADLVLTYAPPGVHTLRYTLGRDESLFLSNDWDERFVGAQVDKLRNMG